MNGSLVKTRRFGRYDYIGDPANTCRIFNECEVDELAVVDISATRVGGGPDFKLLEELAEECFMPVAYGGGITTMDQVERILRLGMEKVIIGSAAHTQRDLLANISKTFGAQCLVAAIDVKRSVFGTQHCRTHSGRKNTSVLPVDWARHVEAMGAGEILLTNIDQEGTWNGFDIDLISQIVKSVSIPVIAHGGAGSKEDIRAAILGGGASAVALGNMVVYQKRGMGVLVNFPTPLEQAELNLDQSNIKF